MMKRVFVLSLAAVVFLAIGGWFFDWAQAYETYSTSRSSGNCANCHGDFRAGSYSSQKDGSAWNTSLHDGHRTTMLSGDCNVCHSGSGRFPVLLNTSNGSAPWNTACLACHGRVEGNSTVPSGAGLRQHHYRAGETVCAGCHPDSNPNNSTLAGENKLPPGYFTPDSAHPNKPTDPCTTAGENILASAYGLDNDGDLLYEANDPDCQSTPPPPPTAPNISVTDSISPNNDLKISYGSVNAGASATQTVTVTNTGNAALTLSGIATSDPLAAPFSIKSNNCPASLAASSSCTVTVEFAPTAAGNFSDHFNISSNDSDTPTVTMSVDGIGALAPTPNISVTDSVSPNNDLQVGFGIVNVGSAATQTVTVTNTGNAALALNGIATTNPLAAPFSVKSTNCPASLAASASCTVTVEFAPTAAGNFNDSFNISSNDSDTPTATVNVGGTGSVVQVADIAVTDSVAPSTDLKVDFGGAFIGTSAEQTVTVTNAGNADLVLGAVAQSDSLAAPFSLSADNCSNKTLLPAASCSLTVKFAPVAVNSFVDSFSIPSSDPDENPVVVSLSGQGENVPVADITVTDSIAPTSDLQVPFGSVTMGSATLQTVTVKNDGNADLTVGAVASVDGVEAPFAITEDSCSGMVLAPASSCTITVEFAPTDTVASSDSFDIPSSDPDESDITVSLNGTGSSAAVGDISVSDSVAPADDLQMSFGDVREGRKVQGDITVTNEAGGVLSIGGVGSENPLAGPFSISADSCSNRALEPGESCTITVMYAPERGACTQTSSGETDDDDTSASNNCSYTDSLDIPSDDPDEPVVTVQVSGAALSKPGNNPPGKAKLIFPANGQNGLNTTLTARWEASQDPDGDYVSYTLRISADPNFTASADIALPAYGKKGTLFAGTGFGFIVFGIALSGSVRGRRKLLLAVVLLVMVGATLVGCGSSGDGGPTTGLSSVEVSRQVSGLDTSTTYYWKVIADDGNGGVTESDVSTFTTQ